MSNLLGYALIGASIFLIIWAAVHDAAARTIPNAIPMLLVAIGSVQRLREGQLLLALIVAFSLLVVFGFLWLRGLMGGGDAKLIPATSLVLSSSSVPGFVLAVTMAGGILALLYWGLSFFVRRPHPGPRNGLISRLSKAEAWRLHRRGPLPYAVAIAAGALFTIAKTTSG